MGPNATALVVFETPTDHVDLNGSTGSALPRAPPDLLSMHAVLYVLHSYYQPSIIGLGLVSNMAALIVLIPSKLWALSSTRYLVASTALDLLFLLVLLLTWLSELGVPVYRMGAFCHVTTFFLRAASFLSTWYAVGLSVDRFLSLCLPGWQRTLCSPTRANVVLVGLTLLALVVFLNISLTVGVVRFGTQYICTSLPIFMAALRVLNRIDAVVNILIPYSLLILLWVVGAVRCCVDRSGASGARRRTVVVSRNHVGLESASGLAEGQNGAYFLYVLTLLLLTTPLHFERCRQTFREMTLPASSWLRPPSPSAMALIQLLNYPYYTRFCLNFFVCFSAHRGFRLAIVAMARKLCKRCRTTAWWPVKDNKIRTSGSVLSLEDLQEEQQSRVALCETNCSAV